MGKLALCNHTERLLCVVFPLLILRECLLLSGTTGVPEDKKSNLDMIPAFLELKQYIERNKQFIQYSTDSEY